MREGSPSATARRVAERRAAHQLIDHPPVSIDPLAVRIVGADDPAHRNTRAFSTSRMSNLLTFAPVDFERESTLDALRTKGFDEKAPAVFSWLGVTMYLARETVMATFEMIGKLPAGSGVAFDYGVSRSLMGPLERLAFDAFAQRVSAVGEPWTTFFDPANSTRTSVPGIQDRSGSRRQRDRRALFRHSGRWPEGEPARAAGRRAHVSAFTASRTASA